jgi:hypothetical protein
MQSKHANLWLVKRLVASSRMGNRTEPAGEDVLPLMVCPTVEAMRRNPPPLFDPEPSARNRLSPARSPAVSSAAPYSLGPGMACRTVLARTTSRWDRERNCCSGVGYGVWHLTRGSQVDAIELREVPIRDAALRRGAALSRLLPNWRASCQVRLVGRPSLSADLY